MANWITDAGHEIGSPEWVLVSGCTRVEDAGEAYEGVAYLKAQMQQNPFGVIEPKAWFGQEITLPDTTDRTLSFWMRDHETTQNWATIIITLFPGHVGVDPYPGGVPAYSLFVNSGDTPDWTQKTSGLINITGVEYTLVVIGSSSQGGPFYAAGIADWRFDTWAFQSAQEVEDVAKRRDIKDAVVSVLAGITVANLHAVEVASVTGDYTRGGKVTNWPEIQVVYGDESRVDSAMHIKKGQLLLHCLVWCKGDDTYTAEEQQDEVLASIESILETQTNAQFIGLSYVDNVNVEDIEVLRADGDQMADAVLYVVTVRVIYRYDRTDP